LKDAARYGDLQKVKNILSEDPSLLNEGLDSETGGSSYTALLTSLFWPQLAIISYLLEQENIDVNKSSNVNSVPHPYSVDVFLF
jgi:hypothetical protein